MTMMNFDVFSNKIEIESPLDSAQDASVDTRQMRKVLTFRVWQ
jgi:hypothetical protein